MTIDAECFVGRAGTYGVGELLIDVRVMDSDALVPRWRPSLYSKPFVCVVVLRPVRSAGEGRGCASRAPRGTRKGAMGTTCVLSVLEHRGEAPSYS